MMNHCFSAYAFGAFVFVLLLCSCSGSGDVIVQEADSETVCEIMTLYEDEEIGRLNSIAVIDSSHFVLSTDSQAYLYDMSGHCISKIGRSGNAGYEYNMPLYVRSDGLAQTSESHTDDIPDDSAFCPAVPALPHSIFRVEAN